MRRLDEQLNISPRTECLFVGRNQPERVFPLHETVEIEKKHENKCVRRNAKPASFGGRLQTQLRVKAMWNDTNGHRGRGGDSVTSELTGGPYLVHVRKG